MRLHRKASVANRKLHMFLAESYLHTLDPFAIQFPASWPIAGIRWYGLSYAVGFLLAWWIVRSIAGKSWSLLPVNKVGDLMFAVILGVLVGGRLGYAVFYEQHLLVGFSGSFPFWDLLAINKGGMASHGGMMGVILAVAWFGHRHRASMMHILDIGALGCTPGFFFGRGANFINAELWGRPIPPGLSDSPGGPPWWSVKYPEQISDRWQTIVQPPSDMSAGDYESLIHRGAADFNIATAAPDLKTLVLAEAQHRLDIVREQLSPEIMSERFFDRVVLVAKDAGAQAHEQVAQVIKPLLTPYYPSQIFQMFTDGLFVAVLLVLIWLRPRKPGVIGSWYLIIYGGMRIVAEMFRQPDAGVPLTFGLLSRGQTLSVLMMLAGAVCLAIVSRRKVPRLGGLLAP